MTTHPSTNNDLECQLAELTAPPSAGEETVIWRDALASSRGASDRTHAAGRVQRPARPLIRRPFIAVICGLLVCFVGASLTLLATPARRAVTGAQLPSLAAAPESTNYSVAPWNYQSPDPAVAFVPGTPFKTSLSELPSADRSVIQKLAITLETTTIRPIFERIQLLINQPLGEHVESSLMSGSDANLSATITLRIEQSRVTTVLQQLRDMGTVIAESSTGEDVTDAITDLHARLRNERRIEEELLALFEARKGAPLDEVMKLRDRIAQVRGEIESLEARQQSLSRLVSLATIHVTIQQPPRQDPPPPAKTSLLDDTLAGLSDATENGLRTLSRSVAGVVQIAIGGLLLWIPIATFLVIWISMLRKHLRNSWREPAPR